MGNNPNAPWLNPEYTQDSPWIKWTEPGQIVNGFLRGWTQGEFPAEEAKEGKPAKAARPYAIMILDTPNGEKELSLTLQDLKDQVFKAKPGIGDMITVKYLRDGKPKLFHVEVTRATAAAAAAAQDPAMEYNAIRAAVEGAQPTATDYTQPPF